MRSALQQGVAAGLHARDLEDAQRMLREEEARAALQSAVDARDIARLPAAIREGESVGLDEGELRDARKVLADEERKADDEAGKANARRDLSMAVDRKDMAGVIIRSVSPHHCVHPQLEVDSYSQSSGITPGHVYIGFLFHSQTFCF